MTKRSRSSVQADPGAELLELLDAAMQSHALAEKYAGDNQLAAIAKAAIERLHDKWAAVRMSAGDDLRLDVARRPLEVRDDSRAATPGRPETPARTAARRKQTSPGRSAKRATDNRRAAYILERYAAIRAAGQTPLAARVQIAAEVNRQMHLPRKERTPRPALWRGTYSEGTVHRVLRRHGVE
jgi:hypothetical protein